LDGCTNKQDLAMKHWSRWSPQECKAAFHLIDKLHTALQRIDGINDNPAIYNPDIEAVLRSVLDDQTRRQPIAAK
jgi:hypothetical protein